MYLGFQVMGIIEGFFWVEIFDSGIFFFLGGGGGFAKNFLVP